MKTIDIKGKKYVEVNERIKHFRENYLGSIVTTLLSNNNGVCIFKAEIIIDGIVMATGHAYETENSSFINKTSYIENCETSAVGRALGIMGIGIDTSIASAEEVNNAIVNQSKPETKKPTVAEIIKGIKTAQHPDTKKIEVLEWMEKNNYTDEEIKKVKEN